MIMIIIVMIIRIIILIIIIIIMMMMMMMMMMILIFILIALKDTIRDFLFFVFVISSLFQHVRSGGQGTIVCTSPATHPALITRNMSCTTWYEDTEQLIRLTEFKSKKII